MNFSTKAIHSGEEPNLKEGGCGDVVTPIHLASTFARKEIDKPTSGYEYSRTGNPTRNALEKRLAILENAKYGLAFASGLAAETTLALSLLKNGDHIVACEDLYGGTRRLFDLTLSKFGLEFTYLTPQIQKTWKGQLKLTPKWFGLKPRQTHCCVYAT